MLLAGELGMCEMTWKQGSQNPWKGKKQLEVKASYRAWSFPSLQGQGVCLVSL